MAKAKKKKKDLEEQKIAEENAVETSDEHNEESQEPTAEEWQDRFMRAQADLQNIRRRLGEETEERVRLRMEALLFDLIRVADYMEAALSNIPEPVQQAPQSDAFLMGITAIQQALESVMMSHGMIFLKPGASEEFNPEEHEAVETVVDTALEAPQMELVTRGYRIGKRILRPAKVKVITPTAPPAPVPVDEDES
ncbi:MAG: nucleotide exchange factor GrpE, partial [Planctomycetes bacterium]|nr:nucleotide exchange factor GrpE [Planctomycetota bacterium]